MIIPVKCFTCGKVLGNKYNYYVRTVIKMKLEKKQSIEETKYLTRENINKTPEGIVLDELMLTKSCCRRHMLTHVDIE
jgi:DNA-directed RNA polymerase I, II, and III subunit RPABC5